MLPICPECQAKFTGRPAEKRASRVCKACGHAFLLHADGTTESLKKKPKAPEGADAGGPTSTQQSEAPVEPPPAEGAPDGAATPLPPPPAGSPGLDESAVVAQPANELAQPGTLPVPASPPAAFATTPLPDAQTAPNEQFNPPGYAPPHVGPTGVPDGLSVPGLEKTQRVRRRSGVPGWLLPLTLVLGMGLGYATRFVPGLAPKPPPAPSLVEHAGPDPAAPQLRFIGSKEPLWAGPLSSGTYPQIAVLPRSSAVHATTARVGTFLLVRDAMGRAGFVSASALVEQRPEGPFVDCARAPFETDGACRARASQQKDACKSACSDTGCSETCSEHFSTCSQECTQLGLTTQTTPASPSPAVEEPVRVKGKKKGKKKGKRKRKGKARKAKGKRRGQGQRGAKAADDEDDDIPIPLPVPE